MTFPDDTEKMIIKKNFRGDELRCIRQNEARYYKFGIQVT
jgi:hypothetical protein